MKVVILFVMLVAVQVANGERNHRRRTATINRSSLPPCQCSGKPGEGTNAVTVRVEGKKTCRGAIVSPTHIITSASCVYGKTAQKISIQPPATVEYYTIYDAYCHVTGQKDIALIKVREISRTVPACLVGPLKATEEHVSLFSNIGPQSVMKKQGEIKKLLQWIQDLLMTYQERMCS